MSRNVRIVLLCEDKQHKAFVSRFIEKMGWIPRDLKPVVSPNGRGSAEQFVRKQFPKYLQALRAKRGERKYLIVMVDGDATSVAARKASLNDACGDHGMASLNDADNVLICVPTWNIETWLAYLDGDTVNETKKDYRRLPKESECAPMVNTLVDMCREGTLRTPAPASLEDTCISYRRVF